MTWAERWPEAAAELAALLEPTRDSAGTSEAATQSALRLAAARNGCALWRNNSGACVDDRGRLVRYGLGNDSAKLNAKWKSSDLIGIGPGGRFMAIEVKRPGWKQQPSDERAAAQARFMSTVVALGGIATFATDVKDVFG